MNIRRSTASCLAAAALAVALVTGCASAVSGTAAAVPGATAPATTQVRPNTDASTDPTTSSSFDTSSSETGGTVSDVVTTDSQSSSSGPTESGQTGGTVDPAEFAARLEAGNAKVSNLIGNLTVEGGGISVEAAFSDTADAGKVNAIDMNLHLSSSGQAVTIRMRVLGSKAYIAGEQLLKQLGIDTDKKWVLASATSSNAGIRTLATQFDGILDSTGTEIYSAYAQAAKSVVDQGTGSQNNVPVHKYLMTLDLEKAVAVATGSQKASFQQLLSSGVKELPYTMWLDDEDRVVLADFAVSVQGVKLLTHLGISSYDTTVKITAPDPSTVYTG